MNSEAWYALLTKNGRVVSYLVATIHQTTNIEDLDPAFKVKTWMR